MTSEDLDKSFQQMKSLSLNQEQSKKFTCFIHPTEEVKYYCPQHDEFMCATCGLERHSDHQNSLTRINDEAIQAQAMVYLTEIKRLQNDL